NRLFFEAEAIFFADRVDIEVDRLSFTDVDLFPVMTHNEFAVANALDNVFDLGPGPTGYGPDMQAVFRYLFSLPENGQALALHVFDQLDGSEYAQLEQVTLDILNPFNTYMGQRLDQAKFGAGGTYASLAEPRYAQLSAVMMDGSSTMHGP